MHRATVFAVAFAQIVCCWNAPAQKVLGRTVTVSYGDLDLKTPQGLAILQVRISEAARRVCGGSAQFAGDYRLVPAYEKFDFEKCRRGAMADVIARLNARGIRVAFP